jgi:hypothetical protein
MNAVFREKDEVTVTPNTDAQLASLHGGVQELRASQSAVLVRLDKTNDRIDKTNERIDAVHTSLLARIDAVSTHLSAEIKAVNTHFSAEIKAVNASLCDKIEAFRKEVLGRFDKQDQETRALDKRIDWVHISAKVLLAILGLCVSIAVIADALRTFGWI